MNTKITDAAAPRNWLPIEHAPKDNKRPLFIAQFSESGELIEMDWEAIWEAESESWEIPQTYYIWKSANGRVEEPTHFAYMDEKPRMQPSAVGDSRAQFEAWAEHFGHDLSRRPIGREGDDSYISEHTHYAWSAWQAALAATGKQQVGEVMRSDLSGYAVAASQVRRGYDVECDRCGKFCDTGPGPCQHVGEVQDSASRLIDAIEGECDGLVISHETAAAILDHVCLGDPWREAVFSEWALTFIDPQSEVPAEILRAVINWNVRTALDPSVSSDAAALVASGAQVGELQGEAPVTGEMVNAARMAYGTQPVNERGFDRMRDALEAALAARKPVSE